MSPWIHRTSSAPGLVSATSSEGASGVDTGHVRGRRVPADRRGEPGPATDVKHPMPFQFVDDVDIVIEVVAASVEGRRRSQRGEGSAKIGSGAVAMCGCYGPGPSTRWRVSTRCGRKRMRNGREPNRNDRRGPGNVHGLRSVRCTHGVHSQLESQPAGRRRRTRRTGLAGVRLLRVSTPRSSTTRVSEAAPVFDAPAEPVDSIDETGNDTADDPPATTDDASDADAAAAPRNDHGTDDRAHYRADRRGGPPMSRSFRQPSSTKPTSPW